MLFRSLCRVGRLGGGAGGGARVDWMGRGRCDRTYVYLSLALSSCRAEPLAARCADIIDTESNPGRPLSSFPTSAPGSPPQLPRMVSASGSRPLVISRDSFDGYVGGNGGRGSPMGGQKWASGSSTPTGSSADAGRSVGGRVCRYWLEGRCLRSDCKFSHDVGKAVCKYVVFLAGGWMGADGRSPPLSSPSQVLAAKLLPEGRELRFFALDPSCAYFSHVAPGRD